MSASVAVSSVLDLALRWQDAPLCPWQVRALFSLRSDLIRNSKFFHAYLLVSFPELPGTSLISTSLLHGCRTLGVTPTANMESVKVAYRRLSKLYHPDTTELPLGLAEQKFVQLREAYVVLSSPEQRRLYDWRM